jgi:hypothetical protein
VILAGLLACEPAPPPPGAEPPSPPAPPAHPGARTQTDAELRADLAAPRHPGDGGGRLVDVVAPGPLPVGAPVEIDLTFEAGPVGVAVGGSVQLVVSGFWGWTPPQSDAPEGPGYTLVEAPDGVSLETTSASGTLFATVRGRALAPGERVRFVYGAGGTARADRFAETAPAVFVGVDADGDGVRALLRDEVVLTTLPGPCTQLVATVPSAVEPGSEALLRVAALDAVGNGPCAGADGPIALTVPPALSGPREARLVGGLAAVPLRARGEGIGVVGVEAGALRARTNPIVARAGAVPIRWADLQIHTARSDGTGAPADVLAYARDVAGLDVAALTDHDHWGFRALDAEPELRAGLREAVSAAARPGFVPLLGVEWTSWIWGHRHVLFFGPDEPWPSSVQPGTDTPAGLFAALRGRDVVVIPHHVAGGPVALDWSVGLDAAEPVVEIASVHGQSADPSLPGAVWDPVDGAFAEPKLAEGLSFGVIGSTDGHDGHPGLAHLAGGSNGLAALVGAEPSPAGVAAALRARSTYATNGPRMVVRFDVDGTSMGGRRPAGTATATVRVVGTAAVERVELWSRRGPVGSRAGAGEVLHATFPVSLPPGDLVWLRVLQVDGGVAWTSPVFFD